MIKIIINLLLIFSSVYSVFFLIQPQFKEISFLKSEAVSYKENFNNIEKVRNLRDKYLESYNEINEEDKAKIEAMIPSAVNEGEMMLMLDQIAKASSLSLTGISFAKEGEQASAILGLGKKDNSYTPYFFSMDLTGTYAGFKNFLKNIEKSLLIIDTDSISFNGSEKGGDLYKFKIKAMIYLKQ